MYIINNKLLSFIIHCCQIRQRTLLFCFLDNLISIYVVWTREKVLDYTNNIIKNCYINNDKLSHNKKMMLNIDVKPSRRITEILQLHWSDLVYIFAVRMSSNWFVLVLVLQPLFYSWILIESLLEMNFSSILVVSSPINICDLRPSVLVL
jgi:hypothetical protein